MADLPPSERDAADKLSREDFLSGRAPHPDLPESGGWSGRHTLWAIAITVVIISGVLLAGWRAEIGVEHTTAQQLPELTAQETARQELVERALRIADGCERLAQEPAASASAQPADDDRAAGAAPSLALPPTFGEVASQARHLAATLGGLWDPWPEDAPDDASYPVQHTAAPEQVDSSWLWEEVTELGHELRALIVSEDPAGAKQLAQEFITFGSALETLAAHLPQTLPVTWTADGEVAIGGVGASAAPSEAATAGESPSAGTPGGEGVIFGLGDFPYPDLPAIEPVLDGHSVAIADAALAAYDVALARTPEEERGPIAQRRDQLQAWISQALSAGVPDARAGYYELPTGTDAPAEVYVRWAEELLSEQWVHLISLIPAEQRLATLNTALYSLHLCAQLPDVGSQN